MREGICEWISYYWIIFTIGDSFGDHKIPFKFEIGTAGARNFSHGGKEMSLLVARNIHIDYGWSIFMFLRFSLLCVIGSRRTKICRLQIKFKMECWRQVPWEMASVTAGCNSKLNKLAIRSNLFLLDRCSDTIYSICRKVYIIHEYLTYTS